MVFVAQEPQSSCTQANIGHISSFKADGEFSPNIKIYYDYLNKRFITCIDFSFCKLDILFETSPTFHQTICVKS